MSASQRRRPRQLPISCQLCRSMKLKCSREQPCSNCISRNVPCERAFPSTATLAAPNPQGHPSATIDHRHDEIVSRLQKLEELVIRSRCPGREGLQAREATVPPLVPTTREHMPEEEGDSKWLEAVGARAASPVGLPLYRFSTLCLSLD